VRATSPKTHLETPKAAVRHRLSVEGEEDRHRLPVEGDVEGDTASTQRQQGRVATKSVQDTVESHDESSSKQIQSAQTEQGGKQAPSREVKPTPVQTTGITTAAFLAAKDLATGLITSHSDVTPVGHDVTVSHDVTDDVPQLSPIRLSPDFLDLGMLVLIILLAKLPRQYRQLQW
jgi:hypothetical protein